MKTELQRFDDPTTPEATAVSDHKDVHRRLSDLETAYEDMKIRLDILARENSSQGQDERTLLRVRDVMKRLDVSEPTALKLLNDGSIRARRVGNQWRISPADLESFVRGGSHE